MPMPSYWQVYDRLSGINNFRKVFEEAKGIAEKLGDPFEQKKRGREAKSISKGCRGIAYCDKRTKHDV